MVLVPLDRLRELLSYDPDTGLFVWRVNKRGHRKTGDIAGSLDKSGYWIIRLDQRNYPAHRLAWLYMTGEWPAHHIDHRDLDKANNRWANLRQATVSQNLANRRKYKNNQSGFKGVIWHARDKRWRADIRKNGKGYFLGNFRTPEEAHAAYRVAAERLYGEFARAL